MKVLPEPIEFEWDKGNKDKNLKKHGITTKEIEQVFLNEEQEEKLIVNDEKHSKIEKRYAFFGKTEEGKKLSIVFTLRRNKIRVITARSMSKKERREYEEKKAKVNTEI